MTRRDYVRIAAALREAAARVGRVHNQLGSGGEPMAEAPFGASWGLQVAAEALADALAADDPRFSRERFFAAAEGGKA